MACTLLWGSCVRIHDSQAHRKTNVRRKHITRILELREMFLFSKLRTLFIKPEHLYAVSKPCSCLNPELSTGGKSMSAKLPAIENKSGPHLWYDSDLVGQSSPGNHTDSTSTLIPVSPQCPRGLTYTWWGCYGGFPRHKQTELAHSFYSVLVSISVFLALSTIFHSINSPGN